VSSGLDHRVVVDSAGTGGALRDHGYDGTHHRAREFRPEWFSHRDLIVVADEGHVRALRRWAPDAQASAKARLLREFDPTAVDSGTLEIDDPYYGNAEAFDRCLIEVERACRGLVEHLRAELPDLAEQPDVAEPADSRT
jgi:protein-tyrosine phosphatase